MPRVDVDQVMRLLARRPEPADGAWIQAGLMAWFNCSTDVPLERCLGLPTTAAKRRILLRAGYLLEAARFIDAPGPTQGTARLLGEWETFVSRGLWRSWRDDMSPPEGAARMDVALFHATKLNRGRTMSERHLRRIVGQAFPEKRPAPDRTV